MKGILTVTPNPALDATITVAELRPGEVIAADSLHRQPGGKGVNLATMLASGKPPVTATGFLGVANEEWFARHLARFNIADAFVRIPGETRNCLKIVERKTSRTTDVNPPGLAVDKGAQASLHETIRKLATSCAWVTVGGSLPPGTDPQWMAQTIRNAREAGAKVAVDCRNAALDIAIRNGADLIKPNIAELRELTGLPLSSHGERTATLQRIHECGVDHVVLSLGADGALFSTRGGRIFAEAPPVRPASTTGAGDALLAGYLAGLLEELSLPARAELATLFAWSSLEQVERHPPDAAFLASRKGVVRVSPA